MDAALSLAFSMHKNPGIYALLLGSGISRSVGIPTGWDVTQVILRQLDAMGNHDLTEDIGYDQLLATLGKTQAERNSIIRGYFEPTPEEREQGLKVPSKAHRAIAELVKSGHIKVILTTNFDRLMEIALEDIGITPDVVRSDDMLLGASPIRHSAITIIQLHGDYRDVRTLNTPAELATYSDVKTKLLDTVFEEYGLIVCGWSATWDAALRDAIFRVQSRRYSVFWIEPYKPSQEARAVIDHRRADLISMTADDFFTDLQSNVEALEKLNRQHPLTVTVAVERVKKLLPLDHMQIELEDLLLDEAGKAHEEFLKVEFESVSGEERDQFYRRCIADCIAATEIMLNMAIAVCWYGSGEQAEALSTVVIRWTTAKDYQQETNPLMRIPPLLLMYVGGIAALQRSHWTYLRALTFDPTFYSIRENKQLPVLDWVTKSSIFRYNNKPMWFDTDPLSAMLRTALRPIFARHLPMEREYKDLFDLFEMVLAVLLVSSDDLPWIGHDAAMKRYSEFGQWDFIKRFWESGARQGKDWGFLKTFFAGDQEQLCAALTKYRDTATNVQNLYPKHDIPDYSEIYRSTFGGTSRN